MKKEYIVLGIISLVPAFISAVLYVINKKTRFSKIPEMVKQVIYGIVFGLLACAGTEYGIPVNGALINCRDASVLIGGLFFGAPAGIIAGFIGGIERWLAVYWGAGSFTRIACSLSTIIAGLYSAMLRKYMFENKKPAWLISLAIGVVMEVFHLTMVFITNMATPTEAMNVVHACTVPMIVTNSIPVMLSSMFLTIFSGEKIWQKHDKVRISQSVQRWLLVTVLIAFFITSIFVYRLQTTIADTQADTLLDLALIEVSEDINDATDEHLLSVTKEIAKNGDFNDLKATAKKYSVAEISLINKQGIIEQSNVNEYVGFDMSSGEQAKEFLCLLGDTQEFVQKYGPISSDGDTMRKYAGIKTDYGFLQAGYDAEQFQNDMNMQIIGIAKNRHVGNTGYILILDNEQNVISSPAFLTEGNAKVELNDDQEIAENKTLTLNVNDEKCLCRFIISEGFYIVSILPETEALQMRNIALYVNTFMEILVFAIMFGLIYLLIKKIVVNQIKDINRSLAKISDGDLDTVVDVRSNEEFASLSDDINTTVDTLKRYIAEASARIDKELEFAENIQKSALPGKFPAFPKRHDFDIYATMHPAKVIGGDFYDFYMTDTYKLHFVIADVSGKGIPAALFMMRAKTELKSLTEAEMPLNEVFTHGNNALCEGNDAGMFVTAWQGDIDLESGVVTYANAGHNPPVVRHGDGKFEFLKSRAGFVLAGMEGVKYKTQEFELKPGDMVYLYTDGVTEATNAHDELFGDDRLLDALNEKEFQNAQELCEHVKMRVDEFVGEAPQFDDITMVAFKFIGTPPNPSMHFEEASIDDIIALTEFVEGELEKVDCPMKAVMQINVAIDEIYSNIVRYGYRDTKGPVTVEVIISEEPRQVSLRFTDEGIPYNPVTKDDPDVTLSAEERKIGGLGIFLVKKTMDDMKYSYENDRNILVITKNI